jgi:hypothetical protein
MTGALGMLDRSKDVTCCGEVDARWTRTRDPFRDLAAIRFREDWLKGNVPAHLGTDQSAGAREAFRKRSPNGSRRHACSIRHNA